MLDVDRVVQTAHVRGSDLSAKMFERPAYLRIAQKRLRTRDRRRGVRREIVAAVLQLHEVEAEMSPAVASPAIRSTCRDESAR